MIKPQVHIGVWDAPKNEPAVAALRAVAVVHSRRKEA